MHLADRLLRMYPGILKCDSARVMALYHFVPRPLEKLRLRARALFDAVGLAR